MSGGVEGIGQLLVQAPPRHGKSVLLARLFPAWLMGEAPDLRLIEASYAERLAKSHSRTVRNLIGSYPFQQLYPHIAVARDLSGATMWDIAGHEGGAIAAGVGGSITGFGARLAILDDLLKGRAEAESEAFRDMTYDWYTDDLLSRIEEPGGAQILSGTRWHQDDVIGRVLAGEDAGRWVVINLPALAEADDPLGRSEGEALWAERFSTEWLERRRVTIGEYGFSSLYQQRPTPKDAGLFDATQIQVVDYEPECVQVVRFYDLAVTTKRRSDYTVGLKLGITADERPVVLDIWREQREAPDVQNAIVQNAVIDGANVRIRLEAEKAGIIELQYLMRDARMRAYTMDAMPPEGDKYVRAGAVASRVNAGRMMIVRGRWNRAFLDELAMFPSGAHDDQVDALSGAYTMLANRIMVAPTRLQRRGASKPPSRFRTDDDE
jgi:predicted phage terminase large subunit-like protein